MGLRPTSTPTTDVWPCPIWVGTTGAVKIKVFDCTLDRLAADFHAHYEALMHPNLLWTQDIAENMEPIATYTSVGS